jgi:hypothetical protein
MHRPESLQDVEDAIKRKPGRQLVPTRYCLYKILLVQDNKNHAGNQYENDQLRRKQRSITKN